MTEVPVEDRNFESHDATLALWLYNMFDVNNDNIHTKYRCKGLKEYVEGVTGDNECETDKIGKFVRRG